MGVSKQVVSRTETILTTKLTTKLTTIRAGLLVVILAALAACSSGTSTSGGVDTTALLNSLRITAISVEEATLLQCPGGGKVYSVYVDTDRDNIRSASETEISGQIVCNGVSGSDGKNSLIRMTAVQTEQCLSGSGLQVDVGLDEDRSAVLEATEITQTEVLCNGKNGEPGQAGPAGANGHSMVFQSISASEEDCAQGGVTTLMALDINDDGEYSTDLPNQQSMTVCHGSNGQDGASAVVSAYTPVDILVPCDSTSAYKEVLLRFQNGSVLASFSDSSTGQNTRFTVLPNGNYRTTDGNACNFSLSTSEDGRTRHFSWGGEIRKSWAL